MSTATSGSSSILRTARRGHPRDTPTGPIQPNARACSSYHRELASLVRPRDSLPARRSLLAAAVFQETNLSSLGSVFVEHPSAASFILEDLHVMKRNRVLLLLQLIG